MKLANTLALATAFAFATGAYAQNANSQSVAIAVQNTIPAYQGASITTYFFNSNTPSQAFTAFKTASGSQLTVYGRDINNNGIFETNEATSVYTEKTGEIVVPNQPNALKTVLGTL